MKQCSFAQSEFLAKKKTTRRERFLNDMEKIVPWSTLVKALTPYYYPDSQGKRGRPPIGLERMLRMYFVQQWYHLADEALEDAIYDSQSLLQFIGIDLSVEAVPDATTLLKFRHLLERHALTTVIFSTINAQLREKGLLLNQGTIVDATIINAPSSTKNEAKERDPEMHSTRKGNQWYFGMKAHIGVDVSSRLVHTVVGTAANEHDVTQVENILHGQEQKVFGDAGYTGADKREKVKNKFNEKVVSWNIAEKRSKVEKMDDGLLKNLTQQIEKIKAQIRARVEHPFHIIKNLFMHRKVRYKGLAKNTAQLQTLFALANLLIAKKALLKA
ncbi:IS5 family transposase [Chromatium okenii]|uniref:IS5/IS1182 family transposase n=1 Tax=Chromatium okenii TaxID=61644 RepID=A0A2S7XS50_9GAMM|nr:IS5 family transposase [Chromatium okenii]PQJ96466.1 IS5/IS1182 family transposase [Chromatium okenii]